MNLLRQAQRAFAGERNKAIAALRQAKVIASDETGVRIEGSNAYHWVFRCVAAVVHHATPTRGAIVVRTMMDGTARGLVLRPLQRETGPCRCPPDLPGPSCQRCRLCRRGQRRCPALPPQAVAAAGLCPSGGSCNAGRLDPGPQAPRRGTQSRCHPGHADLL